MRGRKTGITFLILMLALMLSLSTATGVEAKTKRMTNQAMTLTVKKKSTTSCKLSWKKKPNCSGYRIKYSNGTKNYTKSVSKRKTSYTFKNLAKNRVYRFSIQAYQKVKKKKVYNAESLEVIFSTDTVGKKSTIKTLLTTGLAPIGSTLYIYGGGWDRLGGKAGGALGLSPIWSSFYKSQGPSYDYNNFRLQGSKGLDCAGYVGWTLYNCFRTANNQGSYVVKSTTMASTLAGFGFGAYTSASKVQDFKAGDIMSMSGHVWMVVGQCPDSSVVLMHASPPGVQLCGTYTRSGNENSQAVALAKQYMTTYYPEYMLRYPQSCFRDESYLKKSARMRWYTDATRGVMTDPEGYTRMNAQQVLEDLFAGRTPMY